MVILYKFISYFCLRELLLMLFFFGAVLGVKTVHAADLAVTDGSSIIFNETSPALYEAGLLKYGSIEAISSGNGTALAFSDYFEQKGGTFTVGASRIGGGSSSAAYGLQVGSGGFIMRQGKLTSVVNAQTTAPGPPNFGYAYGLEITDGGFIQYGGEVAISANAKGQFMASYANAYGLSIRDGGYALHNGTLTAAAIGETTAGLTGAQGNAHGVHVVSGGFAQHGGFATATAYNTSSSGSVYGILVDGGGYALHGGSLKASGTYASNQVGGAYGLRVKGGFTQYGGNSFFNSEVLDTSGGASGGNGFGLFVNDGFIQHGGSVTAGTLSNSAAGTHGLYVGTGGLSQHGGELILLPSTTAAVKVYRDGAQLGGVLRPVINMTGSALSSSNPDIGKLEISGPTNILPGAKLSPILIDSIVLDKGASKTGRFLSTDNLLSATYTSPADSLTMDYTVATTNGQDFTLETTRTAWVSEVVDSNNASLASAVENALRSGGASVDSALSQLYSQWDMSSPSSLHKALRSSTPQAATRYGALLSRNMNLGLTAFSGQINMAGRSHSAQVESAKETETYLVSASEQRPWSVWSTPLVQFFSTDATNAGFSDVDETTQGISFGAARRLDGLTVALSGFYLYSDVDAEEVESTADTFGAFAGARLNLIDKEEYTPYVAAHLGYAYSCFDQSRTSAHVDYTADIPVHAFRAGAGFGVDFFPREYLRLTPIFAVDYTWMKQGWYSESSSNSRGGLRVGGDSANSLRGKIGSELEYAFAPQISLTAHAFYLHEFLDPQMELSSNMKSAPAVSFISKGEKTKRPAGNFGLGFTAQATDALGVYCNYDLEIAEKYTGHGFNIGVMIEF